MVVCLVRFVGVIVFFVVFYINLLWFFVEGLFILFIRFFLSWEISKEKFRFN